MSSKYSYQGGGVPYRNAAPYNPNYRFNGGYSPRQVQNTLPPKRSGCSMKQVTDKKDRAVYLVSGWKASKGNMLSVYGRPYSKTHETNPNKKGETYLTYFVTITNKTTGQVTNTSGLYNLATGKLYVPSMNWVLNPRAPRGGYCGKCVSKKY